MTPMSSLPVAELSAVVSTLEAIAGRLDAVGDNVKGTDEGNQQAAELHLLATSIAQAQRRLNRLLARSR
jgi:hypothetical protein